MTLSIIEIILVLLVAFLAGVEGVLDQFQLHQPILACSLVGLVTNNLEIGIILGGTLQMIALGWANIGAAMAPDAALASIASSIILILSGEGVMGIPTAVAIAIPLAVAGLFLSIIVRTISVPLVHMMDVAAEQNNIKRIELLQIFGIILQGLRIAIPACALLFIPAETVKEVLNAMPEWLKNGMAIGGGMVVAVGYAMVINMMSNKEVWPFFVIGFAIAAISELTLIALGAIGVALALIYLNLSEQNGSSNDSNNGESLDDVINNY